MSWEFWDYDADAGIASYLDYDDDSGLAAVRYEHVLREAFLDQQKASANEGIYDDGIKRGMWKYASIPADVIVELKQKGIDVFNRDDHPKLLAAINRDYPWLKTTHKHHQ